MPSLPDVLPSKPGPSKREFVALVALMISVVAMSIDTMLPALGQLGRDLGVEHANDTQLVITVLFLGLAAAQLVFGPVSDNIGRRKAIFLGLALFIVGSALAVVATSFTVMLVARFLQGVGAAGPRIVAVAMVRDRFGGRAMAQVMSLIMTVFILVPALAPAIGQGLLLVAHWRFIFVLLLVQAVVIWVWFGLRQPETLAPASRLPFSLRRVARAMGETVRTRVSIGYTIASGLVFGAFLGYLNSAQQIFQDQYDVGSAFPFYFGVLALAVGGATVLNSRLVMRFGMQRLARAGVTSAAALSVGFVGLSFAHAGNPPLWMLMAYLGVDFFCIGILFGNFNAMAMEPLGHIAGTAAAVISSLATLISLTLGALIGRAFDGTVMPLAYGFAGLLVTSAGVMLWTESGATQRPNHGEETPAPESVRS